MTHAGGSAPVETKVKWASYATYFGCVALLAILNAVTDANLITALPDVAEVFIAPLLPTLITFIGGFMAKHTPRTDPQARGEVGHL